MSEKFDYRELYKEEPLRFRGMQGCGTTDVKLMPKSRPRKPRAYRGLDAWRRKEGKVSMFQADDVPVIGQMDTQCPGLLVHKAIDKYGEPLRPIVWRVTHHSSGQLILSATRQKDAREATQELCSAASQCDATWEASLDDVKGNSCLMYAASDVRDKYQQYRGFGEPLKHCDVPDEQFDANELEKGTEVELEHTDDRATARCIAKAHLIESPIYYQELEKMEKRLKRKKKAFVWRHTGGGCTVGEAAEGSSHPCDDTYENINTGHEITFQTTQTAHTKMPSMAKSLENIEKRAGVKKRG
jgi:hypothetical protein